MAYRATRSERRVLGGKVVELIKGQMLALTPLESAILLTIGSVEVVEEKPRKRASKPRKRRKKRAL